jgi:hypothetical protein
LALTQLGQGKGRRREGGKGKIVGHLGAAPHSGSCGRLLQPRYQA